MKLKRQESEGVIIYVSNGLASCSYEELNPLQNESVWIKITEADQTDFTVVGICYRSQTATEKEIYYMFRAITIASKHQALIMGDFNYPGINWVTLDADSMSHGFFGPDSGLFLNTTCIGTN